MLDKNVHGGYLNNFEMPHCFVFEFRVPDGREFCVKYRHLSFSRYSIDGYNLDHIRKWVDPKSEIDLSFDGTPSSAEEANEALKETGYTVQDIFVYIMEKNKSRRAANPEPAKALKRKVEKKGLVQ